MAYLLVKANYIDRAVFDTNHLSVIRGSGCLLRSAIEHVTHEFSYTDSHHLSCISSGATQGVFEVHGDPDKLKTAVVDCLNRDLLFRLCNFVVVTSGCDTLEKAELALSALFCRQQLEDLSVVPDDPESAMFTDRPCDLNGVRAGSSLSPKEMIESKAHVLSESCALRLNYGRAQRLHFIENETYQTDASISLDAMRKAIDIESMATCEKYPELNRQLALLCVRGINFDQLQSRYLQQGESGADKARLQQDFHNRVLTLRRKLLANICTRLTDNFGRQFCDGTGVGKYTQEPFVRFEPLLWGGNEMIFIVPAWLGFELHEFVKENISTWRIDGQPVRHVSGMVFSDCSVPLSVLHSAVTRLTSSLEDVCNRPEAGPQNLLDCLVIDNDICPDQYSIFSYFYSQFGGLATCRPPLNGDTGFKALRMSLQELFAADGIDIKKLQLMCRTLIDTSWSDLCSEPGSGQMSASPSLAPWLSDGKTAPATGTLTRFCAQEQRLISQCTSPDLLCQLAVVAGHLCSDADSFAGRIWFWLHLSELRPYLCPQKEEQLH